jgi:hypothetical protein
MRLLEDFWLSQISQRSIKDGDTAIVDVDDSNNELVCCLVISESYCLKRRVTSE